MMISVCDEGYYGSHCMNHCQCDNDNFICHPVDGCRCRVGFTGNPAFGSAVVWREPFHLTDINQIVYFDSFDSRCVTLSGDKCDVPIFSPISTGHQGEMAPNSHGGLIAGLIISILLIVMVVAALFYYRRRISHLKSELAHVQYIADPSSAPGKT